MSDQYFQGPAAAALTEAQVAIGILEAKVEHLTKLADELKASNKDLADKMDKVLVTLSEARGGWRMLMLMGGGAATLGGALSYVLTHIRWQP